MGQRIRKGDWVRVTKGTDRGKEGRVIAVDLEKGKIRVEKVRLQKRHLRAGRKSARGGGILEQEGFIDASNVTLVDPETQEAGRARIEEQDGRRVRVFARSGKAVPEPTAS